MYLTKLHDELPAHPARTGWRRDVCSDSDSADVASLRTLVLPLVHAYILQTDCTDGKGTYLHHSSAQGNPFSTCPDRVGSVLYIRTEDNIATGEKN